MAKRTYIDACVLIAACCGKEDDPAHLKAMQILADPERDFVSSGFLRLEVLPRARPKSKEFYNRFFRDVVEFAQINDDLVSAAEDLCERHSLSSLDALHASAALSVKTDVFVTKEKKNKPLHSIPGLVAQGINPSDTEE